MCSLDKLNDQATQKAFNKKVVTATNYLQAYVKHRLYIAESMGVLPRNMYSSTDIIDSGIVAFYEKGYDIDMDANKIKLKLFKIVVTLLDALFKNEAFHKNTMSTDTILKDELEHLEEHFTVDSDMDYIMHEELTDISYSNKNEQQYFAYNNSNDLILNAFELKDITTEQSKKALGHLYSWLPLNVSNIVDLYVFGKLSFEEISMIKKIETKRIATIFKEIKETFKNHIN